MKHSTNRLCLVEGIGSNAVPIHMTLLGMIYTLMLNCSLIRHDCSMNYDGGTYFRSPAYFTDYLKLSTEIA